MSAMSSQDFVVAVSGAAGSEEEWRRALQPEVAGTPGPNAQAQAEERLKVRGHRLGEQVKHILAVLGNEYRLTAVLWEGFRPEPRWLIRIQGPRRVAEIPIPAELADGVVESATLDDLERLKNLVLFGAGRQDLIFKRNA
jgi:hypothetical protein